LQRWGDHFSSSVRSHGHPWHYGSFGGQSNYHSTTIIITIIIIIIITIHITHCPFLLQEMQDETAEDNLCSGGDRAGVRPRPSK